MAYADQKMSGGKMVAIFIVVLIHAALGYAFVTGLAYQYVKKAQEKLNTFDVEEPPPPPPDEPPPPPPDTPMTPPPVVSPPPIVQNPNPPPVVIQTAANPAAAPVAAAPKPELPVVTAYKARKKVPVWAMLTLSIMPVWAFMYLRAVTPQKVEAVGPAAFVTDLGLLENRFQFQRYLQTR